MSIDFVGKYFTVIRSAGWSDCLTLARYLDPGRPPSRANAHNIREAVATRPTQAKN